MSKYVIACAIIFGIFIFLKFVEGSPVRSWKVAFLSAIIWSGIVCAYLHYAFPWPPPLSPQPRIMGNTVVLRQAFQHIEGVDRASIEGMTGYINFSEDRTIAQLRHTAMWCGGVAASFLSSNKDSKFTISMSVKGRKRYEIIFGPNRKVIGEEEF